MMETRKEKKRKKDDKKKNIWRERKTESKTWRRRKELKNRYVGEERITGGGR